MPRNITVTLQNGQTVQYQNVPDEISPDQVTARVQQEFGQAPKVIDGGKKGGFWSSVGGGGLADIGRGAGKAWAGFSDLASSAADVYAQAVSPMDKRMLPAGIRTPDPNAPLNSRMRTEATELVERAIPTPQGDSKARQYLRAGLEGLGGALVTGRPSAVNLSAGAGSGIGGEVAGEMVPGNPLARIAGNLLGGGIAGAGAAKVTSLRPQSAELAREALEGISPEALQKAQVFQAQQAQRGVQVDLAQALESVGVPPGNLATIRDRLAQSRHGTAVQQTLRNQPTQIAAEAEKVVAGLPGRNYGPAQSANNMQEAATGAIEAAKRARSAEVRDLYAQAGTLTPQQRDELIRIAQEFAERPGAVSSLKGEVAKFAGKLRGQPQGDSGQVEALRQAVAAAKTPLERARAQQALGELNQRLAGAAGQPTQALDVDTAIAELMGPYKGTPLTPADPKALGQAKGLGKALNEAFQTMSPAVKAAEARFRQISEETINPLKQSSVGGIAGRRGYLADVQSPEGRFVSMMDRGTDPNAKVSDIRTLAKGIAKQDPEAFGDAFKSWASGKVQSVMKPGVDDVLTTDPQLAHKLDKALFGNAKQWQGVKDAMVVQAELAGQNPTDVMRGMDNLRRLVRGASSRPDSVSGLSPQEALEIAGRSKIANAARIFGFLPFERAARGLEEAAMGKTFRQFDEILTTPEGAATLAALGKVPVMSKKAQALLGTFFGGYATQPGEEFPGNTGR